MNEAKSSTSNSAESSAAGGLPIGSPRHFVLACIGLLGWLADELPALWEQSMQRSNHILEQKPAEARQPRVVVTAAAPRAAAQEQHEPAHPSLPSHHDFELLLQQLIELEQQIDQLTARRAAKP